MNDTKPETSDEHTVPLSVGDPRTAQATIIKVADGYTVTVSLKDACRAYTSGIGGHRRQLHRGGDGGEDVRVTAGFPLVQGRGGFEVALEGRH